MNADGSRLRRLIHRDDPDETPVCSPNGSQILFSSYVADKKNELFMTSVSGTGFTHLTDAPGHDGHQYFSPEGSTIIFNSQRDDDGNGETCNYETYAMNRDGSSPMKLPTGLALPSHRSL
jgi:Tol biopolymer transport system component